MKKVRVVAALIPDAKDPSRYLVQQRLPHKAQPLLWEFPGGKVEAGETDEHALIRECREELAVELRVGKQRWSNVHTYEEQLEVTLVLYEGTVVEGTPQPLSCNALTFATPQQMQALPFCEADLPLIDSLAQGTV